MHLRTACFLGGVAILHQFESLPDVALVQFLPIGLALCTARAQVRPVAALVAGFLWALLHAHLQLADRLPPALEGRDLMVEGRVADLPQSRPGMLRFVFEVERVIGPEHYAGRVRLSWYDAAPVLRAGDRWRLPVRLRAPRGFANPGGFDYEGWLFRRGLGATGYVRKGEARRLADGGYSVSRTRQALAEEIDRQLPGARFAGVIRALAVGDRSGLSKEHWQLFRRTGTSHLMAISGLHIGLVAGAAFFLGRGIARIGCLPARIPHVWPAAAAAALAALAYAALAGFAVPTQRALLMMAVVMSSLVLRRQLSATAGLSRAALAVVLVDPRALGSPGFWLSFLAVGAILFASTARASAPGGAPARWWWRLVRIQVFLGVALAPVVLLYYAEHPVGAPLANLVAVPWVGCVVVPAALIGTLLSPAWPGGGALGLELAHLGVELLWPCLEAVQRLAPMVPASGGAPGWAVAAAGIGVLTLLAPRGWPARWVGGAWMLPLFFAGSDGPAAGALWVSLLDVGQGLSVVVRTERHVLVYDSGPWFSPRFDAGSGVVAPYLRSNGITKIDMLVLSHGDRDHIGGVRGLLDRIPADVVLGDVRPWRDRGLACHAGQTWIWDRVEFRVVHPAPASGLRGNDASCALLVRAGRASLLIPGDLERPGETELLRTHAGRLRADVLVIPHHGSATSSSPGFLDAVRPRLALLSVGYRNRFGLPAGEVMARYLARGVLVIDTAESGSIELRFAPDGRLTGLSRYRVGARRYWHWSG